jgi:succinate dehydrogenase/fumarate reductase flavoprotein subunit
MRAVLGGEDVDIPGRRLPLDLARSATESVVERAKSDPTKLRDRLQRAMTAGAGVVRTGESLAAAAAELEAVLDDLGATTAAPADEVRNLAVTGLALVAAATARTESRGNHWRDDFPATDPTLRLRLVLGA